MKSRTHASCNVTSSSVTLHIGVLTIFMNQSSLDASQPSSHSQSILGIQLPRSMVRAISRPIKFSTVSLNWVSVSL